MYKEGKPIAVSKAFTLPLVRSVKITWGRFLTPMADTRWYWQNTVPVSYLAATDGNIVIHRGKSSLAARFFTGSADAAEQRVSFHRFQQLHATLQGAKSLFLC